MYVLLPWYINISIYYYMYYYRAWTDSCLTFELVASKQNMYYYFSTYYKLKFTISSCLFLVTHVTQTKMVKHFSNERWSKHLSVHILTQDHIKSKMVVSKKKTLLKDASSYVHYQLPFNSLIKRKLAFILFHM